jgi:hypothetical protein
LTPAHQDTTTSNVRTASGKRPDSALDSLVIDDCVFGAQYDEKSTKRQRVSEGSLGYDARMKELAYQPRDPLQHCSSSPKSDAIQIKEEPQEHFDWGDRSHAPPSLPYISQQSSSGSRPLIKAKKISPPSSRKKSPRPKKTPSKPPPETSFNLGAMCGESGALSRDEKAIIRQLQANYSAVIAGESTVPFNMLE